MDKEKIIVGMADLKAAKPPFILTTLGLGSCVGIALYDKVTRVSGLAHAMLPDSTKINNNSNKSKFVDTSVIELIKEMTKLGANKKNLVAKLAGGAQMFAFDSTVESMRIGDRNTEAAIKVLGVLGIPLLGMDTGKNYGRTIELLEDGMLLIKTIEHGTKIL